MRPVVLVYPPTCDPTAPYLSLPTLTGFLRSHGVAVTQVDANVEAFDALLNRAALTAVAQRLEHRLARLEQKAALRHTEQLLYATLWAARGDALVTPPAIDDAVAVIRDRSGQRFYDVDTYGSAVATVEAAMRLISAAYAPLMMTFTSYRTPFSLLNATEIAHDAAEERNPFHAYFSSLIARISAENPLLVGISVAFPGQIQPAYSLAHMIKQALPGVHLTVGGPALTQLFQKLPEGNLAQARGPFDSVVTYEGEHALLALVRTLERGDPPDVLIRGEQTEDMATLPPPDFQGLPLEKYFAPELVLPYDPTRGCYWGKCTFCHYGLAEVGTASYRERPVEHIVEHLTQLQKMHGVRIFYLSQDAVNPKTVLKVARAITEAKLTFRWSTDMRPERSLTPQLCGELRKGGALSMALGVESASPRVLDMIDKGVPVETVKTAIENLSGADIGVEAMCFSDFPTESYREAMATVQFVDGLRPHISLFICGEFDLTKGSLVAQNPGEFGIAETWRVEGDELGMGLFYREEKDPKTADQRDRVDEALHNLSRHWRLEHYPWAGALSTAHTLLFYERFGKNCFRDFSHIQNARIPGARTRVFNARFDVLAISQDAPAQESLVWETLVYEQRSVGRGPYCALTGDLPEALPSPGRYQVGVGGEVTPVGQGKKRPGKRQGRRQSTSVNALKEPVRGWS